MGPEDMDELEFGGGFARRLAELRGQVMINSRRHPTPRAHTQNKVEAQAGGGG